MSECAWPGGDEIPQKCVAVSIHMSDAMFSQKLNARKSHFFEDEFEAIAEFFRNESGRPLTGFPHLDWDRMEEIDRKVCGWNGEGGARAPEPVNSPMGRPTAAPTVPTRYPFDEVAEEVHRVLAWFPEGIHTRLNLLLGYVPESKALSQRLRGVHAIAAIAEELDAPPGWPWLKWEDSKARDDVYREHLKHLARPKHERK
jgi:hypothetical protein